MLCPFVISVLVNSKETYTHWKSTFFWYFCLGKKNHFFFLFSTNGETRLEI